MNFPEIPQPYIWILEGLLLLIMIWFVRKNHRQLQQAGEDIRWKQWVMILVPLVMISSIVIGIFWHDDPEVRSKIFAVARNIFSWVMTVLIIMYAIRFLYLCFRDTPNSAAG